MWCGRPRWPSAAASPETSVCRIPVRAAFSYKKKEGLPQNMSVSAMRRAADGTLVRQIAKLSGAREQ